MNPTKQLYDDLIKKYQIQLDTVREIINTTDDERIKIASEACERFINGFIIDLKAITAYEQSETSSRQQENDELKKRLINK